jgi:fumarylacetoacetase
MTAFGVAAGVGVVARVGHGRVVALDGLELGVDAHVWRAPSLNRFMALGPSAWEDVVGRLASVDGPPIADPRLELPFEVADYVDFYSSIHHASNLGRLFRPDAEPLLPNWKRLPVGYHGRAGTVVVSGTSVRRPTGLVAGPDGEVARRPTGALDIELEVGVVIGVGSDGAAIAPDDADRHVFGVVLVNDWSARDIQAFEYQPLGPFLGKSFCTTVGAWVVPLVALRDSLVQPPVQEPPPDEALRASRPWGLDLELGVELNGVQISRTSFAEQWWTFAQQLAHLTSNGSTTRTGDLLASGTVSGPDRRLQAGSLIELTWRGAEPLELPDGSTRTFLADGDTVVLRGRSAGGVELGECAGTVVSDQQLP